MTKREEIREKREIMGEKMDESKLHLNGSHKSCLTQYDQHIGFS
jgi:hypothetical protein